MRVNLLAPIEWEHQSQTLFRSILRMIRTFELSPIFKHHSIYTFPPPVVYTIHIGAGQNKSVSSLLSTLRYVNVQYDHKQLLFIYCSLV
jgi:hypothetical protein